MKKVLLGTSAIALAGAFATSATAAEWDVRVGGYMKQYVAYGSSDQDVDGDYNGIDSKSDAEIFFAPSITLENGLKIGANVQLEAGGYGGTADTIDEQYMFIKGAFGEILLGSENSVGYKMSYGAPDVSLVGHNSSSLSNFMPFTGASGVFRGVLGSTFLENDRNNDANRFSYFSPRFSGFQVGVSYARDGRQDSNTQIDSDGTELHDLFDVGANYVNSFDDFNVVLSGRYGTASKGDDDPDVWGVGLNLGFSGVTLGGSYAKQNDAGPNDGESYDVGISYNTGPWGFSIAYLHGESVGNGALRVDVPGMVIEAVDAVEAAAAIPGINATPSGTAENGDPIPFVEHTDPTPEVFAAAAVPEGYIEQVVGAPAVGDETLEQYVVGVSYAMAKGVSLHAYGAYVDFSDAPGEKSVTDFDGWVIGTGIKISF